MDKLTLDQIIKCGWENLRMSGCHDSEEKNVSPICEQIQLLEKRIKELENYIYSSNLTKELDPKVWVHVADRLDKLESYCALIKINDFRELCVKMAQDLNENLGKIPHKCPVCDGSGRYKLATALCASDIINCHSCEGKGIVWG